VTPPARFTRFGEAFERRDREAWDAEAAPDITMVPLPGWPDPGPFIGRDAAWAFMVGTEEPFDEVGYRRWRVAGRVLPGATVSQFAIATREKRRGFSSLT
jgi:hypothetical protein